MKVIIEVLLLLALATDTSGQVTIAGYATEIDVSQHSFIDLDVRDVETRLLANDFTGASTPYLFGGNSLLPTRFFRTLEDLGRNMETRAQRIIATDPRLISEFFLFRDYYGDAEYAHSFIISKFSAASNGLDNDARRVLALRGIQLQLAWMNALFEFYNALEGCLSGEVRVVNWDEGVAFYVGSIVQSPANALQGYLQCTVSQQGHEAFPHVLNANDLAFLAFENGQALVQSRDCTGVARAVAVIKRQMLIPLVQGLVHHSRLADASIGGPSTETDKAQAWSFVLSLLPFLNASDEALTDEMSVQFEYGSPAATYNSSLAEAAVFASLGDLCLTCQDIGLQGPACAFVNISSTCPEPFTTVPGSELTSDQELFSVPAFFIVFREALEAAIVCAVLYGIIRKTNTPELEKYVWYGIVLGLMVTLTALVILLVVVTTLTSGAGINERLLLQGSLSIVAAILVGYLALTIGNLLNVHKKIEKRIEVEVEDEINGGLRWQTVLFLSFTAIAREGIETVVFLGVTSNFEAASLPIPIVTGAVTGITIGYLLYSAGNKFALKAFFRFTVVLLVFIGAGIFAHGLEEFQVVFDYGEYWEYVVWNLSKYTSLRFEFWGLMRALFGWTPYPSRLELVAYFSYHIALWGALLMKYAMYRVDLKAQLLLDEHVKENSKEVEVKGTEEDANKQAMEADV